MTDIQMIEFMAECWTDNGGDSENFVRLQAQILERIKSIETYARQARERGVE